MLTEQRYQQILALLDEKKSVTVAEIRDLLDVSESTARRDITALHNAGKLVKVFGGAVAAEQNFQTKEYTVAQKVDINREEKKLIARYAASLMEPEDFVYIDAGTTTGYMLDYIEETTVRFVTNAVAHAQKLAAKGLRVFLTGGELKSSTEAVVGNQAMETLRTYHFTKGFFGADGISHRGGFTTPDINEAVVKRTAMEQCEAVYVLADHSKFGGISSVTFAGFERAEILTDSCPESYRQSKNVHIVGETSGD